MMLHSKRGHRKIINMQIQEGNRKLVNEFVIASEEA